MKYVDHQSNQAQQAYNTNTALQTRVTFNHVPLPNTDYLYIGSCMINMSSVSYYGQSQLHINTVAEGFASTQPKDVNDWVTHFHMAVVNYGGSPPASVDANLRYATTNTLGTVTIEDALIIGFELESTDVFVEAGSTACAGTSWTDVATLTHTFLSGEDYYLIASAKADTSSTAYDTLLRLHDGTTAYGLTRLDHVDASNSAPWGTAIKITGDGTSKTFKIQGSSSNSLGTNTVTNSCIVAVRASLLSRSNYAESRTRSTTTSTAYTTKVTTNYDKSSENHLDIYFGVIDGGSTTSRARCYGNKGASIRHGVFERESSTTGVNGGAWGWIGADVNSASAADDYETKFSSSTAGVTTGFAESGVLQISLAALPITDPVFPPTLTPPYYRRFNPWLSWHDSPFEEPPPPEPFPIIPTALRPEKYRHPAPQTAWWQGPVDEPPVEPFPIFSTALYPGIKNRYQPHLASTGTPWAAMFADFIQGSHDAPRAPRRSFEPPHTAQVAQFVPDFIIQQYAAPFVHRYPPPRAVWGGFTPEEAAPPLLDFIQSSPAPAPKYRLSLAARSALCLPYHPAFDSAPAPYSPVDEWIIRARRRGRR